ncbi:carbon-nitrogen hydrolase family protein [Sporichthya polymorpha]|uniref:carbon-nitrogen hydrolase family protein n=1 Tax=Sporichthya polymorpha TaxID=35751 RepID=UPI000366FF54|nr:carbon-nitrogen hydrolase family protein [Sporichthya polymorpha]
MQVTVAAVQATPVFLDTDATVEKATALIKEAADLGAQLIVFPEAFVPTYPDWVWRLPAWSDGRYTGRLYEQAVQVPGPVVTRLGEAAREAGAYVAMGINEIEGGTLYNTLIYLAPDGSLAGRHRKLMPTGGERTVWGYGDGSTLDVVRTPFGVVGGLICWENYMPLARAAMYARGVEIHLAPTWDNDEAWISTLRHIAKEGRCYVIGVSPVLRGADVPADLRGDIYRDATDPDEADWMSRGLGTIVAPGGAILAGPLRDQEGIVVAEIDVERNVPPHRRLFDPVGHYARPDVFTLNVNTRPQPSVRFDD